MMIRLLIIGVVSLASMVLYLVIFYRLLGLSNDAAGWISYILALVVSPMVLLKVWKGKPSIDAMPIDIDDPIMQEHIKWSREQLPRFFKGLDEGKREAFIKFSHQFGEVTEHVWGLAHAMKNNKIIVSLESTPIAEMNEVDFERFSVPIALMEDWMLVDGHGNTQGGYSLLAMAKIYERDYGKLPKRYVKDLSNFTDFVWKPKENE